MNRPPEAFLRLERGPKHASVCNKGSLLHSITRIMDSALGLEESGIKSPRRKTVLSTIRLFRSKTKDTSLISGARLLGCIDLNCVASGLSEAVAQKLGGSPVDLLYRGRVSAPPSTKRPRQHPRKPLPMVRHYLTLRLYSCCASHRDDGVGRCCCMAALRQPSRLRF
jgi:hypothetical protein